MPPLTAPDIRLNFRSQPTVYVSLGRQEATLNGVLDQAAAYGWRLLDADRHRWTGLDGQPPVGAIVNTTPEDPRCRELLAYGCPVVRLDSTPHPEDARIPTVALDQAAAGRMAAEHFAEHRFRHLAYLGHEPWGNSQSLYVGFAGRGEDLGLECHLLRLRALERAGRDENFQHFVSKVREWLDALPKPLGLFAYHDPLAVEIVNLCLSAGYAVPADVAVLGYGNQRYPCKVAPVPLSSIDQDLEEHGRQAVRILHRRIAGEGGTDSSSLVPPKRVVARQSTNLLAVDSPLVSSALRYMWDRLDSPLAVDDIAAQVGVCRRALERAFRKHLHCTIKTELARKRLQHSRQLLRTTKMPVAEIAHAVGLRSRDHLHETFRQTFGMTPRQYRLSQRQRTS